jgi:ribosomal protein S27AE
MKKTLKEYLEQDNPKKPKHLDFGLNSEFYKDPRKNCPNCGSKEIHALHTHNPDGSDYQCSRCLSTYTLWYDEEIRAQGGQK